MLCATMGRVLISEPHADVRSLFEFVVERLGHEPLSLLREGGGDLPPIDAMILEPAAPSALALARDLRARSPDLPIVCASIFPAEPSALELGPLAYLEKPFGLSELEYFLRLALDRGAAEAA
jgi:DNA-binding response OmpR family regulator